MCEYCDTAVKFLGASRSGADGVDASIVVGQLRVSGWFDGIVGIDPLLIPINYCPMCGRDLRKETK